MSFQKNQSFKSRGQFIAAEEFQALRTGFIDQFPDEMSSVFIPKQVVSDCLKTAADAAGITFRYGLGNASDPLSRKIILIPCQDYTNASEAPEPVLLKEGYLCHTGERVELDQLWPLLGNHVARAHDGNGHAALSKIHRAYSWGIEQIKQLAEHDNCEGLVFHFGYDPTDPRPCKRNQNILEAVVHEGNSPNLYLEYGQCTPPCSGRNEEIGQFCLTEAMIRLNKQPEAGIQLDTLRTFRDHYLLKQPDGYALHEMYYFVSGPILQAIQSASDPEQILLDLYENEMQQCIELIRNGKTDEVSIVCKAILTKLLDTYVFETVAKDEMVFAD